ncbi:terminase large subunit domain-containing protein [Hylemonella gracilis]|uniref:terminase large subunit domain-containing protein n=1 Tax=Hylemonella gracilis TaxID=80880 RepID=UPI000686366E|nr:terminase family protein [Hylemonella gracilis]
MEAEGSAWPPALRLRARSLYWQCWRVAEIAEELARQGSPVPERTVRNWCKAEGWDAASPLERVKGSIEARLIQLVAKEIKSGGDFKEIDLLGREMERLARVGKYTAAGADARESDLNPNIKARNAKPKKKPKLNVFTPEHVAALREDFEKSLFDYQRTWYDERDQRTRFILKSRQIGATWYFAREALLDSLETGRNQIFLSASRAQANVFKQYITAWVRRVCDIDLKGDPLVIVTPNGDEAEIHFLSTSARTAQSYHGNLYFDEVFWTPKFAELNKVASGMAMQKQYRKTYFSTPSAKSHEAYAFWSGERLKRRSADASTDGPSIDISHARLAGSGFTGEDRVWRNIVTIMDALAGGCDLFDIEELRFEYSEEEFDNLLMCLFIDDSKSVFPLAQLQACMVDSWVEWHKFYKPLAARPYGDLPVWIGYDPGHTGDAAGLVVVAAPQEPGGKLRVLERHRYRELDFEAQAEAIKVMTLRYNVEHIAIDSTGLGQGVYQLVKQFFPTVKEIQYSIEVKNLLVLRAQKAMRAGRLEFDAGWVDLAHSFLAIHRVLTDGQRNVTYKSGRNAVTGHADLAWALMNALDKEPLEGAPDEEKRGLVEIY